MGYSTHPGLVEENVDLLRQIKTAIEMGAELRLEVPSEFLSTEQYRMRRILRSADIYKTVCEGEFVGLGTATTVSADAESSELILKPRFKSAARPTTRIVSPSPESEPEFPSEENALEQLRNSKGNMEWLEFRPSPSFSPHAFRSEAKELGWNLSDDAIELEETIAYGAERIQREGFSALFGSR